VKTFAVRWPARYAEKIKMELLELCHYGRIKGSYLQTEGVSALERR